MKKYLEFFLFQIKQMIGNRIGLIAIICNIGVIFHEAGLMIIEKCDLLEGLQSAYVLGMTSYITPVLVSLPYVMKFHEETTTYAYRYQAVRAGKLQYVIRKTLEGISSSLLIMVLSLLGYTLVGFLHSRYYEIPLVFEGITNYYGNTNEIFYCRLLEQGKGWLVYFLHCLFLLCYGMIWPCIGMMVSLFAGNRLLALASPFLMKRLLEYICPIAWNPAQLRMTGWLAKRAFGGSLYALCYLGVVALFCILALFFRMQWQYQQHG